MMWEKIAEAYGYRLPKERIDADGADARRVA